MNIIDPNSDMNVYFGRILVLINELSVNKNEDKILTIERIIIYEFLIKYPLILSRIMRRMNKKNNIDVKEYEVNTVSTSYPSYNDLYKFNNVKSIVQLLYAKGLVEIDKQEDGTFTVSISQNGNDLCESLISIYFTRIKEICSAISLLHSASFASLRSNIKSSLYE